MAALSHRALQGYGVILLYWHTRFDISQRTEKVLYVFKELVVGFFFEFWVKVSERSSQDVDLNVCPYVLAEKWGYGLIMEALFCHEQRLCLWGSKLSQQVPRISLSSLTKEITSSQKYGTVEILISSRWALLWPLQICSPEEWSFDFSFGFVSNLGYYIFLFTSGALMTLILSLFN